MRTRPARRVRTVVVERSPSTAELRVPGVGGPVLAPQGREAPVDHLVHDGAQPFDAGVAV
ncbi:hypothetical protein GQS52_09730 [Streptomyces sp. SCUT-3]|uniref:hypothetical protein n=1 Tax=Streptomyces sp. SCUT-3 TaxID=2684469 RepID=UPI0015FE580B|nr:hypothetical protein [Streptomyces sp. SCUT-3]QMV22015.1 hypothetical protein GQS52_09730 [Streptomyces sp. SCUT-3]